VWQLLGVEKIQNGSHCHGNQGAKNVNGKPYSGSFCPFFVSMAIVAKFVQLIPIFLAYLILLDVDVVPIKFHQFLFGE
jgi:hypothetical protein